MDEPRTAEKPAADTPDPLSLDRQLCFQFYAASNLITRLYRRVLAELGLTYPQYLVMLVLWETDGITVGALGTRLHLDSGTVTPLLKRMETLGLLSRNRDAEDQRRVHISLTSGGRALKERAASVPETIMRGHDADQLKALRPVIANMVSALASVERSNHG